MQDRARAADDEDRRGGAHQVGQPATGAPLEGDHAVAPGGRGGLGVRAGRSVALFGLSPNGLLDTCRGIGGELGNWRRSQQP